MNGKWRKSIREYFETLLKSKPFKYNVDPDGEDNYEVREKTRKGKSLWKNER